MLLLFITMLLSEFPQLPADRVQRGVEQAAALWTPEDGSQADFESMVRDYLAPTDSDRLVLFEQLSAILEKCNQSADLLTVELLRPTQLTNGKAPGTPDWIMSAYSPMAHFSDDMFANRLAFLCILNFPHYTLQEKEQHAAEWSRLDWAMARLGDVFTTRVPARVNTQLAQAYADAENYIADYNIYMGHLLTEDGRRLFPADMVLLSHWNLRDELKSCYSDRKSGPEKQEMIYQVMQRIVRQQIPASVINSPEHDWQPYSNLVDGQVAEREPDTRYQRMLDHLAAYREQDRFCPQAPTAIQRNFDEQLEFPVEQIDSLFRALLSSPQVKMVAREIRRRLGRPLRPYDIWYDGFKQRASLSAEALDAQTRALYPDADAFAADMPRLLRVMGFAPDMADEVAAHIVVEPARGSGHAWPSLGRQEPARLRTRIPESGMNYKGYNIAVHEFGHTVEQVLDMYFIDYYMLSGVPNTAYTEASAFLFQQRDLGLLPGAQLSPMDDNVVLDNFWSMYEIMGVSLVDMAVWRWLYQHPEATAAQLRDETVRLAQEVWNQYYAPVLGEKNSPLLAIYSHMVDVPMYLPNYPLGYIVQFQLEEHLAEVMASALSTLNAQPSTTTPSTPLSTLNSQFSIVNSQFTPQQSFAAEYQRIYRLGRLTPNEWMRQAVDRTPSVDPVLRAVSRVLKKK